MNEFGFKMIDNSNKVLEAFAATKVRVLEMWGILFERNAKKACPVGTAESTGIKGYRGGTLRNSITHEVDEENSAVMVGSNVEYAPYVELGTGPYFTPPPEWENFDVPTPSGIGKGYVHARPFLRTGVTEHIDDAHKIAEIEFKKG